MKLIISDDKLNLSLLYSIKAYENYLKEKTKSSNNYLREVFSLHKQEKQEYQIILDILYSNIKENKEIKEKPIISQQRGFEFYFKQKKFETECEKNKECNEVVNYFQSKYNDDFISSIYKIDSDYLLHYEDYNEITNNDLMQLPNFHIYLKPVKTLNTNHYLYYLWSLKKSNLIEVSNSSLNPFYGFIGNPESYINENTQLEKQFEGKLYYFLDSL